MSILNNILKTFVGDKTKKDLDKITPLVSQIKTFEKQLEALSHDELRAKTADFKTQIEESRAPFEAKIKTLLDEVEATQDLDENQTFRWPSLA